VSILKLVLAIQEFWINYSSEYWVQRSVSKIYWY